MKAVQLYKKLENDFITPEMSDDWIRYMDPITDFLCDNFRNRSIGLMCDFATEINKAYTAVFPSVRVMKSILDDGIHDAMFFVHHPSIWDIRKAPEVFQLMDRELLQQFRKRRISIYNLHNYGPHSTSVTLAKTLGLKPEKAFALYFGSMAGVFGKTDFVSVQVLKSEFEKIVNHRVSLYQYGDSEIKDGIVAVVAGGGLDETIEEIAQNEVNVLVTGITAQTEYTIKAHEFAEKQGINILGGTHYSTEKFACKSMVRYFTEIGLLSYFIEDEPVLEDM